MVVFSVLGYLAGQMGVPVEDVAKGGQGLAFVAYPEALASLPLPWIWSILFFLMLFTLGLDSQFAIVETVLTGILDFQPKLIPQKTLVVGLVCVLRGRFLVASVLVVGRRSGARLRW